jgi:hypothetical protein
MFNEIIDSQQERAEKAAQLSQSSESSFFSHRSKERLKIEMLKETLRQWNDPLRQRDEYYSHAHRNTFKTNSLHYNMYSK